MKSGGPWNLRGLRPEARSAAREAARRSGLSVGEWLNTVIQPAEEDDEDAWWSAAERQPEQQWHPRPRNEEPNRERHRDAPPRRRGRESEERWRHATHDDDLEADHYREPAPRRRATVPDDQYRYRVSSRDDSSERDRWRDAERQGRGRAAGEDERSPGREGRPYREAGRRPLSSYAPPEMRDGPPRRERQHHQEEFAIPTQEDRAQDFRAQDDRGASIDKAIAEIEARQRALESETSADIKAGQRAPDSDANASIEARRPAPDVETGAEIKVREVSPDIETGAEIKAREPAPDIEASAEIEAKQRAFESEAVAQRSFGEREPQPLPPHPEQGRAPREAPAYFAEPPIDLSGLERQLRQITTKIEALQPNADLGGAIEELRAELAAIGRSLTEALPRHALESLEIEIKALAERIDHSRQSGVDTTALAGIERGLAEVREALGSLTPAESLVGFDEAVKALAKKVDALVARDDPATLQQLETAIGALRGIVSHVASNDTLTKVAEDVRDLAAKVDGLAASAPALSALEIRIDRLAGAIDASTEAGHAVPRELEKLLSGLIEKLEWVQLTHTDHSALAHLEDRIATLVKRLDMSDARLGLLEGVERGLSDLLVYIEQLRSGASAVAKVAPPPPAVETIEQEVAEIKETERRTQDSLEDVQGTVEHVVDRLAMLESDMRSDKTKPAEHAAPPAEVVPPPQIVEPVDDPVDEILQPLDTAVVEAAPLPKPEPATPKPVAARTPIDPSLPPDHPLEPGSAAGRSRQLPSAADRIAASEAVIGSKPPVIPDPGGGKSDFIAAARRAAKAAAAASPPKPKGPVTIAPAAAKKLSERLRTVIVAAAVVAIVVGGFHILSRLFTDAGSSAPSHTQTEKPRVLKEPPHSDPTPLPPRVQTEPTPELIEPPHVQTQEPSPPAAVAPVENSPANAGAGSAQNPAATPAATTRRQSLLDHAKEFPDYARRGGCRPADGYYRLGTEHCGST